MIHSSLRSFILAAAFSGLAPAAASQVLVDEDFSSGVLPTYATSNTSNSVAVINGKLQVTDTNAQGEPSTPEFVIPFANLAPFEISGASGTPQLYIKFDWEITSMISNGATAFAARFHVRDGSTDLNSGYVNTLGFNFGGRATQLPSGLGGQHQLLWAQESGDFSAANTGTLPLEGSLDAEHVIGLIPNPGEDPGNFADDFLLWHDFGFADFPGDGGVGADNTSDGVVTVEMLIDAVAGTNTTTLTHVNSGDTFTQVEAFNFNGNGTNGDLAFNGVGSEQFRWRTGGGAATTFTIDNLYIEAIPEPVSLALLVAGGMLIGLRRRTA